MDLTRLIKHPELLNKETLYELRSITALYPYYQTARLLMLRNLYLLHDTSFDEELRRAAIYMTDLNVIFNLVEAAHYNIERRTQTETQSQPDGTKGDRTNTLIDSFLNSIPIEQEKEKDSNIKEEQRPRKRKPTPADATVDYIKYMLETEEEGDENTETPKLKGQSLIDNYLTKDGGKIVLQDKPEYLPPETAPEDKKDIDEGYFTETLAKIYIKQGKYAKALEIIQRLNLNYPKKNAYFADQIRFLKKLIANNNNNKQIK